MLSLLQTQIVSHIQNSSLLDEEKEAFVALVESMSAPVQNLVLQVFLRVPGKIDQIWEIVQKKSQLFSSGVGDIESIVQEEFRIVTE